MAKQKEGTDPPLRLEWIDPAQLEANPANWRTHPDEQKTALAEVVSRVGWAQALLYNERTGRLIDGHARKEVFAGKGKVPVLIGSWSDEQEATILATLDPLAAMAGADAQALGKLLERVDVSPGISSLLEELAAQAGVPADSNLKLIDVAHHPRTTWVLVGIETVRYGEIANRIEELGKVAGIYLEIAGNDAPPHSEGPA